eukprot:803936-Prorocentrum_minimum.AAC.3
MGSTEVAIERPLRKKEAGADAPRRSLEGSDHPSASLSNKADDASRLLPPVAGRVFVKASSGLHSKDIKGNYKKYNIRKQGHRLRSSLRRERPRSYGPLFENSGVRVGWGSGPLGDRRGVLQKESGPRMR